MEEYQLVLLPQRDVDWLGHLADERHPTRMRVQDKARNPRPHPYETPLVHSFTLVP